MIRTAASKAVLLAAAVLFTGATTVSCSKKSNSSDSVGSVGMAVVLSPGVTVNSVSYAITGGVPPLTAPISGTINVTGTSATVSLLVSGIPAGTGYLLNLNATSTDMLTTCAGMATFDVVANQSATADLSVTCTPNAVKTIQVNGMTDYCPTLGSDSASPPAGLVGGPPITLAASGRSYYSDPLMFMWEASSGQLATPDAAVSLYTCTEPGRHELTVTVTDGNCPDSASLFVTCLPAPDAGTDASGDARGEVGGML
jgi:hypothetical protein